MQEMETTENYAKKKELTEKRELNNILSKEANESEFILNLEDVITAKDIESITNNVELNSNKRRSGWLQLSKYPKIVELIKEKLNIGLDYCENINVVEYQAGDSHGPFQDAYLFTVTLFLSDNLEVEFPEKDIRIGYSCGDCLMYRNVLENSDTQDINMNHTIRNITDTPGLLATIYIRNKDKNGETPSIKDTQISKQVELEITELEEDKINTLPETLQVGDYIPFIKIKGETRIKELYNYCNEKPFAFITVINLLNIQGLYNKLETLLKKYNVIILFKEGEPTYKTSQILYTKDIQLSKILCIESEPNIYIADPNRRIASILNLQEINENSLKIEDYLPKQVHVPYLLIENALDDVLLKKIKKFYEKKKKDNKLIVHSHKTKDRRHVHPDSELEKEIDHKLSRSVLPELRKVFYFDAEYRETYKICSYDAETSGRFHPHRDTPAPYQHRKYALSLFLNDDYEGGEFVLPEYGLKVKPKANTAFIFPGISTHQVLPVTKGSRMTIISFFVNGSIKPQYKMKAHYYKDKNIIDSEIYPL